MLNPNITDIDTLSNKRPSRNWAVSLLANRPDLIDRDAQFMEPERIDNCTPEILTEWYNNLNNSDIIKEY